MRMALVDMSGCQTRAGPFGGRRFLIPPTERVGFYLPSLCKVLKNLILQLNSNDSKDLNSLVDLLFLHDFLLSCDAF
jgi:hypothetical protein